MEAVFEWGASLVISAIETLGYGGIFLLMALESVNVPIPSEIVMPFSGYLVSQGAFSFFWTVVWGAAGNLAGSLVSYGLGYWSGRPLLARYGKFFFVAKSDVELAEKFFARYGAYAAFFSRLLPVVRTFISFPAGVARMPVLKFSLLTFAGSFLWSALLTYLGVLAGGNWKFLEPYFRTFDWAIGILFVLAIAWWIRRHLRQNPQS